LKIYTRSGDRGQTGLIDGSRVAKDHRRVAAYGDVDELAAALGVVKATTADAALQELLHGIQRDLFAIGAQLADPKARIAARKAKAAVSAAQITRLEQEIDAREAAMPPLRAFLLAGGSPTGALLHLARTICRRAERSVVTLARRTRVDPLIVVYLNRLSDLLFVLARHENLRAGHAEERW
jgi:cob(I)alamin adenosyltransferase